MSLEGDFGTLTVNTTTGAYSYVPNGLIETLDDGEASIDTFTVTVSDGINPPVSQTFTVNLTGADDPPTLAPVTSGSIAEVAQSTTVEELGLSGTLAGDDVDAGDTLTYGIAGEGVVANEDGTVSLAGAYGTLTVNTSTGAYSYAPDYEAIETLNDGDTPIDQFTVTVSDGDGPPVSQIYTVNLTGSNEDTTAPTVTVDIVDASLNDADNSSDGDLHLQRGADRLHARRHHGGGRHGLAGLTPDWPIRWSTRRPSRPTTASAAPAR